MQNHLCKHTILTRMFAVVLVLCSLVLTAGCSEDPGITQPSTNGTTPVTTAPAQSTTLPQEDPQAQPITVQTADRYISEMTEDYIALGSVEWQNMHLPPEQASAYPKLAEAFAQWNTQEDLNAEEQLENMLPDAKDAAAQQGHDFNGYAYTAQCWVQRADSNLVSIRSTFDTYTGGVRPFYGSYGVNIDPETGAQLTLSQVLTDWEQLPALLTQALQVKYPDIPAEALESIEQSLQGYSEEAYTWTVNYQGITFYFAPSELLSSALGELIVTLGFADRPDLFVGKYTAAPAQGYAIRLNPLDTSDVDLDPADGKWDRLTVYATENGLTVECNDATYRDDEFFAYYTDSYLVTPDGKSFYLYLDSAAENDFRTLRVFDLSGSAPQCIATLSGDGFTGEYTEHEGSELWVRTVFNDPSEYVLSARVNLLGTFTGNRVYHTHPDTGIPTTDMAYYEIPEDRYEAITTKLELELLSLPHGEAVKVSAGTALYPLRSDNESYLDVAAADGREFRICVQWDDWSYTVNGIPETECFDNLLYAG